MEGDACLRDTTFARVALAEGCYEAELLDIKGGS
jgi:hypothetical protein